MSTGVFTQNWEILMVALMLAAAHVVSPWMHDWRKHPDLEEAFGAGLSVAYVFLHLIPALDAENDPLGERVYFIALLGFSAFYGLEMYFHKRPKYRYHAYLVALFVYTGLQVFALGLHLPPTAALVAIFGITLAIDAINTDIDLCSEYGSRFLRGGRWILAAGVFAGYGLGLVRRPDEFVVDAVTAGLAGFMIFLVAKALLPISPKRQFWPFLLGLSSFAVFHIVLE